jgi:Flp pilus assembly protein TadD
MNNFEAALADLSRSIALGENAEAYLMRGSIYAETGRLAEASGDIDRSLQLKPGLPDAIRAREAIREALSTAQD